MWNAFLLLFVTFVCAINAQKHSPYGSDSGAAATQDKQFIMSCPTPKCRCSRQQCGLEVDCSEGGLTEVPRGLSPLTECLDLSMNNISKISADSFAGLKQLLKLSLFGNVIATLPQGVLTGFRKMHTLSLENNRLTTILPNTISKMASLKNLNLGANFIKNISANAFAKLDSLEHVWLDDNRLTEIPYRALSKAPNIKALNLVMNKITTVRNGDLDHSTQLKVLLLKHNEISEIENNAFERSINIQIVDLSYNELTSLPLAMKKLIRLDLLSLVHNKIESLPDLAFMGNPDLREVTLTGNPIKNVGRSTFTGLQYLKRLSIENAENLKDFPDLSGCSGLTELVISGGKLKNIPPGLCGNLPSLKTLSLKGNFLKNLTGVSKCRNLTILDVSENELTKLSFVEVRWLNNIIDLNVSNNQITHIDDNAFSKMHNLQKVDLSYNSFEWLPTKGLENIRVLNISGVRTMLYLPPNKLFQNLHILGAYYTYHCCQVAKIARQSAQQLPPVDYLQNLYHYSSYVDPHSSQFSSVQCSPQPGPLTPCDDLLPSVPLRIFSWVAMVIAFVLNTLILLSCGLRYCVRKQTSQSAAVTTDEQILGRAESDSTFTEGARMVVYDDSVTDGTHYCLNLRGRSKNSPDNSDSFDIALCHLAFSDFLVSSYTAVLLSYDHATRGEFAENGAWWQQSALCHSAGFLLTFGTQLGFTTIAIMSVERYLATVYPLQSEKHMRKKLLILSLSSAWAISLATAIVTLFGNTDDTDDFGLGISMPEKSGATCLPWTTDFVYISVLVGLHILVCFMAMCLCLATFCGRRKHNWLSTRKSTRLQVTLAVGFNIICILPLAVTALYVSGMVTYSDDALDYDEAYFETGNSGMDLDIGRILSFVMFIIPLRPLLNPLFYISFNKALRKDVAYVSKKIFYTEPKPRNIQFPQHNHIIESMFDSVPPREKANGFQLLKQPSSLDNSVLQQSVAYDNGGIVSSSSVSYYTPPTTSTMMQSLGQISSVNRTASDRRRRRRTRSRRNERRGTDTDPTTESDVITFHQGGEAVSYNPEGRERRKKKLSVRCGGVNARDEFQRLVFPRIPQAQSSSHGSDSTIQIPIMPASRNASSSNHDSSSLPPTSSIDVNNISINSVETAKRKDSSSPTYTSDHYDLSALNSFHAQNRNRVSNKQSDNLSSREMECDITDYDPDTEVAKITCANTTDTHEENPFFDDRDTAKRLHVDLARKKTHQRSRSRDEEYLLLAVCNASREEERDKNTGRYPLSSHSLRKDRTASHSSGSSEAKNSCEYCDSSASKDSGIHSEIDSTSGASFSDTSVGRRLHYSTNNVRQKPNVISTIGERDIDRFEFSSRINEFEMAQTLNQNNCAENNTETTI